jgi:hypothetical protein
MPSSYGLGSGHQQQHLHASVGTDVSFVSDSRLLPVHPYGAQGLLSVLGPSHPLARGMRDSAASIGSLSAAGLRDIVGSSRSLEHVSSSLSMPSDRGRVQSQHLLGLGHAAADLEASMNSDSLDRKSVV